MNIQKDLATGSMGENIVTKIFENSQFEVKKNDGTVDNLIDWDLVCTTFTGTLFSKIIKLEVKNDLYAEKSGNIAIEFWNSRKNKEAGINATKADLWVHIIPNSGVYITSIKRLKNYIANNPSFRTIFSGGDGNADMYLYKMHDILPAVFVECSKLTPDELRKTVEDLLHE